jgi:hypothetical protein
MKFRSLVLLSGLLAATCGVRAVDPVPLPFAHAHNDYLHARPLFDALEQGFCSVEADVHLVDGALLVAHSAKEVSAARTLAGLYLEPLRSRVRANGGRVYRNGPPVTLLIDVKTEAAPTYRALHETLREFAELFTTYRDGKALPGAITVIISGNRAPAEMAAQAVRYAALDGRPPDLDGAAPATLIPLISADWNKTFTWRWTGEMPPAERERLADMVKRAHAQGRRIRFWNTPDRPEVWRRLRTEGVDLINTDDLAGLGAFFRGN